jgi:hypothetical protein
MRRTLLAAIATAVVVLAAGLAVAQHHQPKHSTQPPPRGEPVTGPFGLAVHGAFQRMMDMQDFGPKVQLKLVMDAGATEAVGAASGLRGEITAIDGKLLLTYGNPCPTCAHPGGHHATLLASARVSAWREPATLSADLTGQALDAWVVEQAKAAGLDVTKPFPVRLKGTLTGVRMHAIRGHKPGFKGHGSGHAMADQEDIAAEKIDGEVVGFYAPPELQGIITHPGEPFHYHWVDIGRTRTAHLDAFGMAKGTQLLLPRQ